MTVKSALIFSFIEKYFSILIQLATSIILARIIEPEEFGLFAICMFFVIIANVLREFGVGAYIVKEKELNDDKLSSAFTLLLGFAIFTSIVLFYSASYVAEYYEDDRLTSLIHALSLNVIISPFGSIITALLHRNLMFKPITVSALSSQLISSVVTISLGLLGYGAMSLAIGSIVQTFTYAFILQFYKPSDFKMRLSTKKIREIFNYSKYVVGSTFIFEFSNNFSQLVIGKHYTLADVGMYSRAVSTGVLFNKFIADAISPVITPYIAKASRESISIKESYQRIARMHNALAWPFFFYLALLADPVIYILFGEQWKEAAIFLTIICIDRIIGCTLPMTDAVFHGLGKAKQLMYLNGFLHSSRIVLVALTYKVGLVEMILTMSILTPTIGTLGRYWLINKYLGLEFREIVQDLRHPLILSILVILPPISLMLFSYTIYHLSNIQILIISSVISSLLWLKASWHSELVSFGKKMLNRKDA